MDVVEAKPADWQRDPFTPVIENGYLFGRGATDMKLSGTLAIAALIELKAQKATNPAAASSLNSQATRKPTNMKTSGIVSPTSFPTRSWC